MHVSGVGVKENHEKEGVGKMITLKTESMVIKIVGFVAAILGIIGIIDILILAYFFNFLDSVQFWTLILSFVGSTICGVACIKLSKIIMVTECN